LKSQRGVKGGYLFVRDPSEVSVLDIVQLLDGQFDAEAAVAGGTNQVWSTAVEALRNVLRETSIADVLAQETQASGAQMYHI
jgi:Rrf2 family cysteine metabolism transcriptional repressor